MKKYLHGVYQDFKNKLLFHKLQYTLSYEIETDIFAYSNVANPKHVIHVKKINDTLCIVGSHHVLTQEESDKVSDITSTRYYDQEDYIFYSEQADNFDHLYEVVVDEFFGEIVYPKLKHTFDEVDAFVRESTINELKARRDSFKRTLNMYNEDLIKSQASYDKVVKLDPVEKIEVGTILYKYINNSYGVFRYEVKEIDIILDKKLLKVECLGCTHGDVKCVLWINQVSENTFAFFKMDTENSEHDHFHSSLETLFHNGNKRAYDDYLNKIKEYDNRVINEYKQHLKLTEELLAIYE